MLAERMLQPGAHTTVERANGACAQVPWRCLCCPSLVSIDNFAGRGESGAAFSRGCLYMAATHMTPHIDGTLPRPSCSMCT